MYNLNLKNSKDAQDYLLSNESGFIPFWNICIVICISLLITIPSIIWIFGALFTIPHLSSILNQFKKHSRWVQIGQIIMILLLITIGILIPVIIYYEFSKTIEAKKHKQDQEYYQSILNLNAFFLSFMCFMFMCPSGFSIFKK